MNNLSHTQHLTIALTRSKDLVLLSKKAARMYLLTLKKFQVLALKP
ncbi:Uncharacterised protein [Legionella pneumophila]|nr:Uncharacterised protein [Legionella pneumophila]